MGFNDKPEGLRILRIFFAFVDFQSIFQWKYSGGIKWKLLHTKKPAFYEGMNIFINHHWVLLCTDWPLTVEYMAWTLGKGLVYIITLYTITSLVQTFLYEGGCYELSQSVYKQLFIWR